MEDRQQTPEREERNATLDPDFDPAQLSESELQERVLEDSDLTPFQKRIARMSDAQWNLAQRVVGALLGILAGVALFWDGFGGGAEGGFSYSLILAVVLALAVPNIIERRGLRRIPKLRIAMVIALALMIVIYLIVMGSRNGFRLTA